MAAGGRSGHPIVMMGTARLRRYKDIALLLAKHLRLEAGRRRDGDEAARATPRELAADLERLGPTFVKLGQLLSTRPDLLPQEHVEALARLQDDVAPFPFEEARAIVEAELGVRLHKAFRRFDPEPVAAASLAQIHRAELHDGTPAAVKVQRPGIRESLGADLAALTAAAEFADRHTSAGRYELSSVVGEFRKSVHRELDYRQEADNLRRIARNLRRFDRLVVPRPHEDYSTDRVLTMDFVEGRKITALSPMGLNEIDGPRLAGQLFRAYLQQILVDGFFHADPHPGNVVLAPGGRLAILDLGMAASLGPVLQENLLRLLLAVSEGRSEAAADAAISVGTRREGFLEEDFRRRVNELVLTHSEQTLARMNLGRLIFDIARVSADCGLRLPPEVNMIGKALLNLEQIVRTLDPGFAPSAVVRDESSRLMAERLGSGVTRTGIASGLLQLQEFAERLPGRIGKALDVLGANDLRLKVDAVDERVLIQGMQKIANRIAMGLVLAALIVGAALMMQVQTRFRLLGYPGLAILLFLAAVLGGVILILDVLYYDEKRRARLRR